MRRSDFTRVVALFALFLMVFAAVTGCRRRAAEVSEYKDAHPLPEEPLVIDAPSIGRHGGRFVIAEISNPRTFNALMANEASSSNIVERMFLGLAQYDNAAQKFIPGLAKSWELAPDGLTWTFELRGGLRYAPPFQDTPITSLDVVHALERTARVTSPQLGYPSYYMSIRGFEDYASGSADSIAGLETPDDRTLVVRITEATGDLVYRFSLPATAPIPEEVAGCFTESGEYGRYAISSGPYMFEGSGELDVTSCDTMEPIAGFEPERSFVLVRNPDYDEATDSPEMRSNNPDRIEVVINNNLDDIFAKIEAGATLLQLYTGLIYEGPGLIQRIKDELAAAVHRSGARSLAELTGRRAAEWAAKPLDA